MSSTTPSLAKSATTGAVAGLAASMAMAMYAMLAAWHQGHGFFAPLFHIASLFISPNAMNTAMQDAMMGKDFYFTFGPAVLGAIIHMMTGLMFGAIFGVVAAKANLKGMALIVAGAVYGVIVFALSAYVGLPLAAAIFNSGDQISHMPRMAGWTTFLIEHVIFGLALGMMALPLARRAAR